MVEHSAHTCAAEAHCSLLWFHSTTGMEVVKAAPNLMGKLKGDNSMVRKGRRHDVPNAGRSAKMHMAKARLPEP
jgi:hypothetical protein